MAVERLADGTYQVGGITFATADEAFAHDEAIIKGQQLPRASSGPAASSSQDLRSRWARIHISSKLATITGVALLAFAWWSSWKSQSPSPISRPIVAEPTFAERYPGPWNETFSAPIAKALVGKQIRGCGEFKHRESALNRGEFLVYCTRDGSNWVSYIVWDRTGEVMGPAPINASVPP